MCNTYGGVIICGVVEHDDHTWETSGLKDVSGLKKAFWDTLNNPNKVSDLLTADEVRMLDNRYALLFIRGERPVMDLKYDILKHPSVRLTTDGQSDPYIHGEPWDAGYSIELVYDPGLIEAAAENSQVIELPDTDFVLLSEEDVEKELDNDTLQAA